MLQVNGTYPAKYLHFLLGEQRGAPPQAESEVLGLRTHRRRKNTWRRLVKKTYIINKRTGIWLAGNMEAASRSNHVLNLWH